MSIIRQSDDDVPFLDPSDPDFSIRSEAVLQARDMSWWARTPYGLAVLRYGEMKQMINHPLLRQGSYRWPEHNQAGGVWAQWWKRMMLNREGADHARLRKLGAPAFAPRLVADMIPKFQLLADELISDFEAAGKCEFMSRFAEPYATRVVCSLVGVSHERWREFADLAVTMGLALGVTYARDEASINAATDRFFTIAKQIVADRRREPCDDFIGALHGAALGNFQLRQIIPFAVIPGRGLRTP